MVNYIPGGIIAVRPGVRSDSTTTVRGNRTLSKPGRCSAEDIIDSPYGRSVQIERSQMGSILTFDVTVGVVLVACLGVKSSSWMQLVRNCSYHRRASDCLAWRTPDSRILVAVEATAIVALLVSIRSKRYGLSPRTVRILHVFEAESQ